MEGILSGEEKLDPVSREPSESLWKIIAPSLAFAGVQASWAVQVSFSQLRNTFHLSSTPVIYYVLIIRANFEPYEMHAIVPFNL